MKVIPINLQCKLDRRIREDFEAKVVPEVKNLVEEVHIKGYVKEATSKGQS